MATLSDIRTLLVNRSGRYDLVTDASGGDYSDNGANAFINAGQRYLDRLLGYTKQDAWLYKSLTAGESFLTFQYARYIKQVWVANTSDGRSKLERVSNDWLRQNYTDVPLSSLTSDTPKYWAPAPIGLSAEQEDQTSSDFSTAGYTDYDFIYFGNHFPLRGIVIMPPADTTYTVEVLAAFYSLDLSADADVSFWSVNHPELLVRAARLMIETDLHRNRQGQDDFEQPLVRDCMKIYHDMIAEEMAGPPEQYVMGG